MVIVLLASFVITYMQDRMYVGATREAARMDRPLASLEMLRGWIARAKALAWRGQQQNRAEAYELRVNAQPAQPAASGTLFLQWPPQLVSCPVSYKRLANLYTDSCALIPQNRVLMISRS